MISMAIDYELGFNLSRFINDDMSRDMDAAMALNIKNVEALLSICKNYCVLLEELLDIIKDGRGRRNA